MLREGWSDGASLSMLDKVLNRATKGTNQCGHPPLLSVCSYREGQQHGVLKNMRESMLQRHHQLHRTRGEGNWASALVGSAFSPPVHQMLPVRHRTPEHESSSELGVHALVIISYVTIVGPAWGT